jgi:hypothetical protein
MKFIIFLMFSVFAASIVRANECRLPFKEPESSILSIFRSSAPQKELEVPNGKCKLVKQEFLAANGFSCESSYSSLVSANINLAKKYNCYQSAIGTIRGNDHGVPFGSYYAICYICNKPQ